MEEREWIVSPKKLKENQRKGICRDMVEFEETKFYKKTTQAFYFLSGMMLTAIIVGFIA